MEKKSISTKYGRKFHFAQKIDKKSILTKYGKKFNLIKNGLTDHFDASSTKNGHRIRKHEYFLNYFEYIGKYGFGRLTYLLLNSLTCRLGLLRCS